MMFVEVKEMCQWFQVCCFSWTEKWHALREEITVLEVFAVALLYIQCNLTNTSHIINLLETILKNSDEDKNKRK